MEGFYDTVDDALLSSLNEMEREQLQELLRRVSVSLRDSPSDWWCRSDAATVWTRRITQKQGEAPGHPRNFVPLITTTVNFLSETIDICSCRTTSEQ